MEVSHSVLKVFSRLAFLVSGRWAHGV